MLMEYMRLNSTTRKIATYSPVLINVYVCMELIIFSTMNTDSGNLRFISSLSTERSVS